MIKFYLILILSCGPLFAEAQQDIKGNKEVYYGNKAYDKGDMKAAVSQYQKGLRENPKNDAARINLALAQSKLQQSESAVQNFDQVLNSTKNNPALSAMLNYDKGVSLSKAKKYQEAVKAFENSLRVNPEDKNTRENLQKVLNELKNQQQQQNQQQNKDNNKQQQQKKNQQQPHDKPNQQQQNKDDLSKQQAEQLLKALRDQEKETQKKLDAQKAGGGIPKNGKDW